MKIAPKTAKLIRKAAMKIVVSIATLPKNSNCKPNTKSTKPINIQFSSKTFQMLETSKTGHPYFDLAFMKITL